MGRAGQAGGRLRHRKCLDPLQIARSGRVARALIIGKRGAPIRKRQRRVKMPITTILQDLRLALARFRAKPSELFAVSLIPALGIGASIARKTGKVAWRFPLTNPPGTLHYGFAGSPARAGNSLIIGGLDGALYAFPIGGEARQ